MGNRTRDVIKGVGALLGLIVAVGGIPWGLVVVGQGLPTSLPTGRAISDWTASPITDSARAWLYASPRPMKAPRARSPERLAWRDSDLGF